MGYVFPFVDNRKAFGFDLGSSPPRREAMRKALASGDCLASETVALAQGPQGVLVFFPVFQPGARPRTAEAREAQLRGFVLGVFSIDGMVEKPLNPRDSAGIQFTVQDALDPGPGAPFHTHGASLKGHGGTAMDYPLVMPGRAWSIHFEPTQAFLEETRTATPWLIQAGAILFVGLLGVFLVVVTGRTQSVANEVAQRTRELRASNEELAREAQVRRAAELAVMAAQVEVEGAMREALEAQADALEATRAKSEFLANMSHEIRTPMNGVLGMAELLQETVLSPEQQDYVASIARCGDGLLVILNDILDFSKIEAGKLTFEAIPFDLPTLITDVVELHRPKVPGGPVQLLADLGPEVPARLVGDPSRLRQVLGNLVSNAVKFTRAGHVLVATELAGMGDGRVRLVARVEDTGIGISKEAQARLFQPFSQADASTSRQFGGSGLGLVLSRRIIEHMGGTIRMESEAGQGSTFFVELDLAVEPGWSPTPKIRMPGTRALLAVSHLAHRLILQRQMVDAGLDVTVQEDAASVAGALEAAASAGSPFTVAVLDQHLADIPGLELGRELRSKAGLDRLALVLVTAIGHRTEAELARAAGFDAYLTEPLREQALAKALAEAIRIRGEGGGPMVTQHTLAAALPVMGAKPVFDRPVQVLLAEDNRVNQKIALRMLDALGATATLAENGFQVLEALKADTFDVILMDCQMPGMDGFKTTLRIRELELDAGGHLPIIAMTANALAGDRNRCLEAGMDDYITKPVNRQGLWEALNRWA